MSRPKHVDKKGKQSNATNYDLKHAVVIISSQHSFEIMEAFNKFSCVKKSNESAALKTAPSPSQPKQSQTETQKRSAAYNRVNLDDFETQLQEQNIT